MYEKYLEQLEEAGKIRNLKERSINCYKNYVSYFLKYQNKNPEELTCQDLPTLPLLSFLSFPSSLLEDLRCPLRAVPHLIHDILIELRFMAD